MNNEFENKLKRQQLRQIPRDWREEILRTAWESASPAAERAEAHLDTAPGVRTSPSAASSILETRLRTSNAAADPTLLRSGTSALRKQPTEVPLIRAALILWRELIQPLRYAWSGMAALWVLFWIVNARLEHPDSLARSATPAAIASQGIRLFQEQRQVLVELTGRMDSSPPEPPRQTRPTPRSERMTEIRSC